MEKEEAQMVCRCCCGTPTVRPIRVAVLETTPERPPTARPADLRPDSPVSDYREASTSPRAVSPLTFPSIDAIELSSSKEENLKRIREHFHEFPRAREILTAHVSAIHTLLGSAIKLSHNDFMLERAYIYANNIIASPDVKRRRIGAGAHGEVSSEQTIPHRTYAKKVFTNEAEAVNEMSNLLLLQSIPGIVKMYAVSIESEQYVILENARGSLETLFLEPTYRDKIVIFQKVLKTLEILHTEERLVHGDITPGNILLRKDFTPILCDFAQTGDVGKKIKKSVGTLCRAPELFSTACALAPAQDIWSFGITLFYTLFGKYPFPEDYFGKKFDLSDVAMRGVWSTPFENGVKAIGIYGTEEAKTLYELLYHS